MRYVSALSWALVGAAAVICAGCKDAGPSFANTAGEVIRVQAHFDSQPFRGVDWLPLQPGDVFRDPFEHQLVDITVEAHGQLFHLNADQVSKARRDVVMRKQIWLFDGEAICMVTVQEYEPKQIRQCAASK